MTFLIHPHRWNWFSSCLPQHPSLWPWQMQSCLSYFIQNTTAKMIYLSSFFSPHSFQIAAASLVQTQLILIPSSLLSPLFPWCLKEKLWQCLKYCLAYCQPYPTVSSCFLLFLACLNCNLFGAVIFVFCICTASKTGKSPSAGKDQVHNININNNETKEVHSFFEKILQGRAWGAAS